MVDTCPTGITFGNTVTLSPNGEKVLNPHTAYFNNGDYVVVWTEKTSSGPRLEFQLFNGNSNQKISSTPTEGVAVYPASQTDPWLRIGTTAVGVYEDYTFLIAWSTLAKTRDPWNIHVNTYKYDVINSHYTTLDDTIAPIKSSNDNHGKFGFTTLSLSNAFALAYKKDRYTINIPIYTKEKNYAIPLNPIIEEVTASYLMELIVNAVPTQYFFSVVWSPLMNGRGITVQNYKIKDQSRVPNHRLQINSNPRDLKADLSYGGISTVAWHEASDDCNAQNYLTYKVQMLSDAALLGNSFEVSVSTDNQDLDTYLQKVITQSSTRVVATFLKKEITGNKYIVRIFDNNSNLVESKSELLTSTTSPPNAAGVEREAIVLQDTPAPVIPEPSPSCENRRRQRNEVEVIEISDDDDNSAIVHTSIEVSRTSQANELMGGIRISFAKGQVSDALLTSNIWSDLKGLWRDTIMFREFQCGNFPNEDNYKKIYKRFSLVYTAYLSNSQTKHPLFSCDLGQRIQQIELDFSATINAAVLKQNTLYLPTTIRSHPRLFTISQYNNYNPSVLGIITAAIYSITYTNNNIFSLETVQKQQCISEVRANINKQSSNKCIVVFFDYAEYMLGSCQEIYTFSLTPSVNFGIKYCGQSEENRGNICASECLPFIYKLNTKIINAIQSNTIDLAANSPYTMYLGEISRTNSVFIKSALNKVNVAMLGDTPATVSIVDLPYGQECNTQCTPVAFSQLGFFSVIALCNPYWGPARDEGYPLNSEPNNHINKLKTILHELTHAGANTIDGPPNGCGIYGLEQCKTWAQQHPPIEQTLDIVADCLALFVLEYGRQNNLLNIEDLS